MPEVDREAVALVATLHDPDGRFLPVLRERGQRLAAYIGVYMCATTATDPRLLDELRLFGVEIVEVAPGTVGTARRVALRAAVAPGHAAFLACDFDRWLHWAGRFPNELAALPRRVARRRPMPWYVCLGRSARALATHPLPQRVTERASNHALSVAVGRRIDATAGACWLSREGAAVVLAGSSQDSNATDLEWPALVFRADARRLGFLATEGLEFETATFYLDEVAAAGGEAAWIRARYERPDVWSNRLRLAADSVAALHTVLAEDRAMPPGAAMPGASLARGKSDSVICRPDLRGGG